MPNQSYPEFSWRSRSRDLQRLRDKSPVFDVLIVGGGITGAAVAREAQTRGLSCLLVEKGDFAGGTSSRSSKLVHGGVRYLEQFEFGLVKESTRERALLWKNAPQLVTPMPFLFPAFAESRVPLWKLAAGLWLYDTLALFRLPSLHKSFLKARTLVEEPGLRSEGLRGAIRYWDGATDDALLTLANIIDARAEGCVALSRVRAEEFHLRTTGGEATHEAILKDVLSGDSLKVHFRSVVVAGGPWTDALLATSGLSFPKLMATTRGSHIVVPFNKLPSRNAVVMTHPKDGRVLFTIPFGEFTVIGTTDLFDKDAPEKVAINSEEVQYLIDSARAYFPAHPLSFDDVVSTWSGLRPLIAPPDTASASQISREHHLEWRDEGIVVIAGGKLTTHREMAEQTVDTLLRKASSWKNPLGGGFRPSKTMRRKFPRIRMPISSAEHTNEPLGTSEAARLSVAQIQEICATLAVLSLEDLLVRRTQIFYKEPHNGWLLLTKLKPILCEALEWDESEWTTQVEAYRGYVEKNVLAPLGRKLPAHGHA
ncbi:MAG: glycerol-3-phosphate dehydrogenase/oxidase [Bdellovibrionota bacterium]